MLRVRRRAFALADNRENPAYVEVSVANVATSGAEASDVNGSLEFRGQRGQTELGKMQRLQ